MKVVVDGKDFELYVHGCAAAGPGVQTVCRRLWLPLLPLLRPTCCR